MNIHERLEAFWSGEKPDRIPYTIYHNEWKHFAKDPAWEPMYKNGLGVVYHLSCFEEAVNGEVEYERLVYDEGGRDFERITAKTPIGEIYTINAEGWCQKHWLETSEDYRVMTYIVEHTDVIPSYDKFISTQKEILPYGIALSYIGRTPIQVILVDFVGLENFSYHLFDFEDEIQELYEALLKKFRKVINIAAEGPGRYISVLENFTAETMGPARFEKFHIPIYNELFPILQGAGKIVGTHYDGKLSSCRQLIANSQIDLIESLTEPPEGDMTLAECRSIWKDKLFWSNINVTLYGLPGDILQDTIQRLVRDAAPDGRRLAFEVSEHIPENWRISMPTVLKIINEISL